MLNVLFRASILVLGLSQLAMGAEDAPSPKKKILMVLANPATSTTTGWPVGFWGAEFTHPWLELTEAGYQVDVASPDGGKVVMDAYSDPRDASGYSKHDIVTLGFVNSPDLVSLWDNTKAVKEIQVNDYEAVIVAGGQSPMFTFRNHEGLKKLFLSFYESGKYSAVLCHGTALLLELKDKNGKPFIKGRKITGFTNAEEDFADKAVGKKLMPFRIEDEAKKLGAQFITKPAFSAHAIQDGRLITGQQQNSGKEVARLLIKALHGAKR
ncbi:MAG: type 1 glutamine amidotransferase domain-containing protein [Oligoflexus sp.]|jgi:putative intracellular protease/amidase